MNSLSFCLVVPVFNEAEGVRAFAESLAVEAAKEPFHVLWVENASNDASREAVVKICEELPGNSHIELDHNQGYGGGVRAGLLAADPGFTHLGWIPADGQIAAADVRRLWHKAQSKPCGLHKGWRKKRQDGFSARWVSNVYSFLVRNALAVTSRDVNGLPKIAPAAFLKSTARLSEEKSFTWDAFVLAQARLKHLHVYETPVVLHKRRTGKSSWSGKRLQTYVEVLRRLLELRPKVARQ